MRTFVGSTMLAGQLASHHWKAPVAKRARLVFGGTVLDDSEARFLDARLRKSGAEVDAVLAAALQTDSDLCDHHH